MNLYQKIKSSLEKYNDCKDLLKEIYGLDLEYAYDAIIVAPSWKPEKIFSEYNAVIQVEKQGPYFCGYKVNVNGKTFGYIQASSCAGNIIDCCLTIGQSKCKKVIFIGAVGALKEDIRLGDIVIPEYSIAGDGGSMYLYESISTDNFRKRIYPDREVSTIIINTAKNINIEVKQKIVYCTDSILCEYMHLEDILSLGSELIEMETASFFRCMDIIEKPGFALLCVSKKCRRHKPLS
ncbi:MAG: hypothetical protein K0R50_4830 [Eubacterium sp.]|nr:hypothetical protein [Eubacterium sp.]